MKRATVLAVLGILVVTVVGSAQAPPRDYKKLDGPLEVTTIQRDWKDARRGRDVPVTVYVPKGKGPFPVIVFSHGLGGTRDGYAYLGRHWASHGYVCVHLQHRGSDDAVWKGSQQPLVAMRKAARDLRNAVNRPLDVRFALSMLEQLNRSDQAFKGRLDLKRVGMAGHSFGGWTTQAVVGQVFVLPTGREVTLSDPRVKAGIIMSPSASKDKGKLDRAFAAVKVPCLHLTGTRDTGMAITEVKPAERRVPFDHIKQANQYLVIFQGGDHMIFSGRLANRAGRPKEGRFRELILMSTTAFWDAYLKEDRAARAWLDAGGLRKALGTDGTLEAKKGTAR